MKTLNWKIPVLMFFITTMLEEDTEVQARKKGSHVIIGATYHVA
jgi:hypothetical protein